MADFNLPSVSDIQSLSVDPRTQQLAEVPGAVQGALNLADVLQQKRLERQKQIEALKEQVRQHLAEVKASKLAAPITPQTPASTQVPASLGQVANVNPETGVPSQMGPQIAAAAEARRPGLFQEQAIQTQPKEAIKDIFAEMRQQQRPAPRPTAEYTPVTGVLSKNGKPLVIDKFTGEIKESGPEAKARDLITPYAQQRKAYSEQQILNNVVPGMSKNKVIKDSANILFQDQRLQTLNEFAKGNPTPQETRELTIAFDRILRGGGAVPVTEIKALAPRSAAANGAALWQWITANPTGTNQKALIDRLVRASSRESKVAQQAINKQLEKMKSAIAPEYQNDKEFMKTLANAIATQSQPEERAGADLYTKDPQDSLKEINMSLEDLNAQIEELQNKQ